MEILFVTEHNIEICEDNVSSWFEQIDKQHKNITVIDTGVDIRTKSL